MFKSDKNTNNMITKQKEVKKLPQHGFINELARLCDCSRHTVRTAIYNNTQSQKAEFVRKMYRTKYSTNI